MNELVYFGIGCIAAAIVGGGLKAFNIMEIGVIASVARQVLLAAFGVVLIVAGVLIDRDDGSDETPPAIAIVSVVCQPATVQQGDLVTCRAVTSQEPESYDWLADGAAPRQSADAVFETTFTADGSQSVTLQVCNSFGCSEQRQADVQVTSAPVVSSGTLTLTLGREVWADFDEGRIWDSHISINLEFSDDYEVLLSQNPGGLALWGGLPDGNGIPRLKMAEIGDVEPGRLGCAESAPQAATNGFSLRDLGGQYVCMATTDGRIAQFRIVNVSDDTPFKVTLEYVTWQE
jgi:hypothetical protein